MGYSLSVYLLDIAATRALVGSRDEELLSTIQERHGAELERDDDWFSSEISGGAPTAYDALRAVIHDGPYSEDRDHAFQYAYAYKRLCDTTGSFLDNSQFSPFRGSWLDTVDSGLGALRIKAVSVAEFEYSGGMPGGIPSPDFLPGYAEWTHEECVQALEQFEETKREGHAPPMEPAVVDAAADVVRWLRHAAARPGYGVMGFVS